MLKVCPINGRSRAWIYFRNTQRRCYQISCGQLTTKVSLLPFITTNAEERNVYTSVSWPHRHSYVTRKKMLVLCSAKHFSIFMSCDNYEKNMTKPQNGQKFGYSNSQQPTFPPGSEGTGDDHWGPFILGKIHALEESSRWHGYNVLRWGLSGLVSLLMVIYLFRDQLKDNVADEVADVASRSLADENVVFKAHAMTKEVLERLVSEPETIILASDFVTQVLEKEELRRSAVEFASSVLNHPNTQAKIQEITWNTIYAVINNEETKVVLLNFIKSLIEDVQTREACHHLLVSLTKDPSIQEIISDFFKSVLASPKFQMEAILLGREVTNNVVLDQDIQKQTGDALWNAVKHGLTPYWFRS